MKYLSMLKKEENAHQEALPKLPEPPIDSFDSDPKRHVSEKQEPEPESLRVFSKALRREITVSWHGDNPAEVYVEGQPYSLAEIGKLKDLGPEAARAAHKIKTVFMGAHTGQPEEDPPEEPEPIDYDAEITAVIHEFDEAGIIVPEVPVEIRREALALEDEITEACNAGDVPRFREALHAWRAAWMRSLH